MAARSAVSSAAESAIASVVSTTSMVASPGASMPAPLAIPPTVNPPTVTCGGLGHRVGGHDRGGGIQSAARGGRAGGAVDTGKQLVHRQPQTDQPGRRDRHPLRRDDQQFTDMLCGGHGVGITLGTGAGVGAAGVQHDGGEFRRRGPSRMLSHQRTGAALTRFEVKTPAAV